ncbi:COX15/CtaA family protein [Flavobacterium agricola]|uniref:COX15/CtaA family protein n=1 Tax=Flavobacterium agricola TaxID=2870839 RepID=A0ABY6LW01_9FLAO|nr:COX15/CtaA family protein [Flavobacterium agricola]UYW00346.1 COX15/CtaA family protein [Flavobacterium agricola]
MKKNFVTLAKTSLILVYLVIIAGGAVRMTGSGMGCPDWPKCFGYYIPPTDEKELLWEANHEFNKGQVIIKDKQLWVAKSTFTSTATYNPNNWELYTKHDYAVFNVFHTWTEYINRLFGALAGFACLAMAIASFSYWKEKKAVTLLSWLVVFSMGFQAWLGATVVYSVLNPLKITTHMVMALVIVAFILNLIKIAKTNKTETVVSTQVKTLLWVTLGLTLVQVIMGTQVRELVDHQVRDGVTNTAAWLANPNWQFYFHRTFSIVVVALNLWLFSINKKQKLGLTKISWVIALLVIEVLSGMAMYYLDFPFGMQTTHLVFASILFGVQYYLILETKNK